MLARNLLIDWIRVDDQLPSEGPEVLIAWERIDEGNDDVNGVSVGWIEDGVWYFNDDEGLDGPEPVGSHIRISHWMPLPDHPNLPCMI